VQDLATAKPRIREVRKQIMIFYFILFYFIFPSRTPTAKENKLRTLELDRHGQKKKKKKKKRKNGAHTF
jgi:hypothetical protein